MLIFFCIGNINIYCNPQKTWWFLDFQRKKCNQLFNMSFCFRQRCNRYTNCNDTSDEWDCKLIEFPQSYVKEMVPVEEDWLPIKFALTINYIPSVNTAQLKFTSHSTIHLKWSDFRLKFQNLRNDTKLNRLSVEEMTRIWSPVVIFGNSLGVEHFQVDASTYGVVIRHTEGTIHILDRAREG